MLVSLFRMELPIYDKIIIGLALFFSATLSIILHENAHGFVALKCGDPTAKENGRLTFNPLAHFDWMGLVLMLVVGFGWAKPVPINPYRFKKRKQGIVLVSLAGVVSNLLLASVALLLLYLLSPYLTVLCMMESAICLIGYLFEYFFIYLVIFNIMLAFFNLLPVCPLDGFRLLDCLLPHGNPYSAFMYKYGNLCLIGFLGVCYLLEVIGLKEYSVFYQVQQLAQSLVFLVL